MMKLQLNKIAEIVKATTDISLMQMRSGLRFPEFVKARHLFLNIAIEFGEFKNKKEITAYINTSNASISYAIFKSYEIKKLLNSAKKKITAISKENYIYIYTLIENLNTEDKISIMKSINEELPPHKKQIYSH